MTQNKNRKSLRALAMILCAIWGICEFLFIVAGIIIGLGVYTISNSYLQDLPDIEYLKNYQPNTMTQIQSHDGTLIGEIGTERRVPIPLATIPEHVRQAFISAEDKNFWHHEGIDVLAILRALKNNVQQPDRRPMGASTITQQLAKNFFVGNEISLTRKIREAVLSNRMEKVLGKERILELYLNQIFFGNGAYGIQVASTKYFGKDVANLTTTQAALLAALPKSPTNYNPLRFPENSLERRNWVLKRMQEDGYLTLENMKKAAEEPLGISDIKKTTTPDGSEYFQDEVRRQINAYFGTDRVSREGMRVQTSLNLEWQKFSDAALREGLMAYDQRRGGWRGPIANVMNEQLNQNWVSLVQKTSPPAGILENWRMGVVLSTKITSASVGFIDEEKKQIRSLDLKDLGWAKRRRKNGDLDAIPKKIEDVVKKGDIVLVEPDEDSTERVFLRQIPLVQGALVSLDPRTGRVLSMSGGWSYAISKFNRATMAERQPGSSFKPFVYLTAMEQDIPPNARFLDGPFTLELPNGKRWSPNNYGHRSYGMTPLRIALEKSLNLITVRLADRVGMEQVAETAKRFHVVDRMPPILPAALGAIETTPIRMAAAYGSLKEDGRNVLPTLINKIEDRNGNTIWVAPLDHTQLTDPASAFQIVTMMQGVVQRGTGIEAGRNIKTAIAGKTGTSQNYHDAWFVGFSKDIVTAVWIGFDNPSSLGEGETGGTLAAPIWNHYMQNVLKHTEGGDFVPPKGIKMVRWNIDTGKPTNLVNKASVVDAFKEDTEPGIAPQMDDDTEDLDTYETISKDPEESMERSIGGVGDLY